jgi:hypothetical protein
MLFDDSQEESYGLGVQIEKSANDNGLSRVANDNEVTNAVESGRIVKSIDNKGFEISSSTIGLLTEAN